MLCTELKTSNRVSLKSDFSRLTPPSSVSEATSQPLLVTASTVADDVSSATEKAGACTSKRTCSPDGKPSANAPRKGSGTSEIGGSAHLAPIRSQWPGSKDSHLFRTYAPTPARVALRANRWPLTAALCRSIDSTSSKKAAGHLSFRHRQPRRGSGATGSRARN